MLKVFSQAGAGADTRPTAVIAHTVKGKGVSFMENNGKWHRSIPTEEEYLLAKKELEMQIGEQSHE